MKKTKAKRRKKYGNEDLKLIGLIEKGKVSLDEKPDASWLTFGAEFTGLKEEQFKWAFDRSMKCRKCKELGALDLWHSMRLRL